MAVIDGISTDLWNIPGHYAKPQQDAQQILFPNYDALSNGTIPWNVVTAILSTISGYPQAQNTLTPAERAEVNYWVNTLGVGLAPLSWGTPATMTSPNANYAKGLGTPNWAQGVNLTDSRMHGLGSQKLSSGGNGSSFGDFIRNLGTGLTNAG